LTTTKQLKRRRRKARNHLVTILIRKCGSLGGEQQLGGGSMTNELSKKEKGNIQGRNTGEGNVGTKGLARDDQ